MRYLLITVLILQLILSGFIIINAHRNYKKAHAANCQAMINAINRNMEYRTEQCVRLDYSSGCIESVNVAFMNEVADLRRESCDNDQY